MSACPLVMIEWEDSAQPIPSWSYLANLQKPAAVLCASVGWLVSDGESVKALAPNMGAITNKSSVQVSGVIQIPTRCIRKITKLKEPRLTSASDPSSRPAKGRKLPKPRSQT